MSGKTSPLIVRSEYAVNWIFNSNILNVTTRFLHIYNMIFTILQQYNFTIIKLKVLPTAFYVYINAYKKRFIFLRDYTRKLYKRKGLIDYSFFNISGIRFLSLKNILRLRFVKYGRTSCKFKFKYVLYLLKTKRDYLFSNIFPFVFNLKSNFNKVTRNCTFLKSNRNWNMKKKIVRKKRKLSTIFYSKQIPCIYIYLSKLNGVGDIRDKGRWLNFLNGYNYKNYKYKKNVKRYKTKSFWDLNRFLQKKRYRSPRIYTFKIHGFFKLRFIAAFLSGIVNKLLCQEHALYVQNIFNSITNLIMPKLQRKYLKSIITYQKFIKVYVGFILFNSALINIYIQYLIRTTKFKKHIYNLIMFAKYLKVLYRKHIILMSGLKFQISGKLGGKLKHSKYKFKIGENPNASFNIKTSYNLLPIYTKYGVFSAKLWLYKTYEPSI